MPSYFGMVTTAASAEYTAYALRSFFEHTSLAAEDAFFLIDNDNTYSLPPECKAQAIQLIVNPEPLSFAANANQIMRRAAQAGADLYFLNNDLIFTAGWYDGLVQTKAPCILSPLSNREVHYTKDGYTFSTTLALADYLKHQSAFLSVAAEHRQRHSGLKAVMNLPFFCIKIPHNVYSKVGLLDQRFGRGGAEDNDYCLRALGLGFKVAYVLQSYILHFVGRSTWCAETRPQEQERIDLFRSAFLEKWGPDLSALFLAGDTSIINKNPLLMSYAQSGNLTALVKELAGSRPFGLSQGP